MLLNRARPEDVIRPAVRPGLDFLASGEGTDFALSLLYVNRLREFIAQCKSRYDKIIMDSPPIIGVSDASVLTSVVDGVVLVIQHRRSPRSMILRARQIVDSLKTPILGVVLSQVPQGVGEDYSYYTKNYAYYSDTGHVHGRRSKGEPEATRRGAERLALRESDPRKRD